MGVCSDSQTVPSLISMSTFKRLMIFGGALITISEGVSLPNEADSVIASKYQEYIQKLLATSASARTSLDKDSPTAKAAEIFFKSSEVENDLCTEVARIYVDNIAVGASPAEAIAIAASVYIRNYKSGIPLVTGSPCHAADIAFREAVKNPVMVSALAYMKAFKSESPCYVAGRTYVESIAEAGEDRNQAGQRAAKSFIDQIQSLAAQGKATIDPTCAKAALAYTSSLTTGNSAPLDAAMRAFMSKSIETGVGYDENCYKAAETFFDSHKAGKAELASTFAAARNFISNYKSNPTAASRSPCAAAAKAYATALKESPSPTVRGALFAFLDDAILSKDYGLAPVCEKSALAYFDTYVASGNEEDAIEAAANAYIEALDADPNFDTESPCGKAAQAYIALI